MACHLNKLNVNLYGGIGKQPQYLGLSLDFFRHEVNNGYCSTLHICWGAQAGLYFHYGIPKYNLSKKMFGVFPHKAEVSIKKQVCMGSPVEMWRL